MGKLTQRAIDFDNAQTPAEADAKLDSLVNDVLADMDDDARDAVTKNLEEQEKKSTREAKQLAAGCVCSCLHLISIAHQQYVKSQDISKVLAARKDLLQALKNNDYTTAKSLY